jgi:hypothetical protein
MISVNLAAWSLNGWFALVTLVLWLFVALLCVIFSKE